MSMTRDAEILLVLDQRGEAGGVGRDHQRRISRWQRSMQVARLRTAPAAAVTRCMLTPRRLAEHAARVADAAAAVDGVADGDRVDDAGDRRRRSAGGRGRARAEVGVADLVTGDRDLDGDVCEAGMAAGDVDDDIADGLAGHLLGGVHGGEDGALGRLHVDDGAAAQAARELVADADHLRMARSSSTRAMKQHDLGGADVERGDAGRRAAAILVFFMPVLFRDPLIRRASLVVAILIRSRRRSCARRPCPVSRLDRRRRQTGPSADRAGADR